MADLLLNNLPLFLAPAPVARFRPSRVALRLPRAGSSRRGWCRKISVCASELELVYSTESPDGSVVFRFGTASEIAEYIASKKVRNAVDEVETAGVENPVIGDQKEGEEDMVDKVWDVNVLVDDSENCGLEISNGLRESEVDCTSNLSEEFREEEIHSDSIENSHEVSLDLILNVSVVEPFTREEKDGFLETESIGVVENTSSYEVESEKELRTVYTASISDGEFEHGSEKESVTIQGRSVHDDHSETNLEKEHENVERTSISADDFESNVKKETVNFEKASVSDEDFESEVEKEFGIVESSIPDKNLTSYGMDQSTVFEDGIIVNGDLDPVAPELDLIESVSLEEPSNYVDKEDAWSHSGVSEVGTTAVVETSSSSEVNNIPVAETSDFSENSVELNGGIGLSTIEETKIPEEDYESDDKEIPVVNGTLIFGINEKLCNGDKEYVPLQKTSLSEVTHNEGTPDFSSLPCISMDTAPVVECPPIDEISNQKSDFEATNAAGSHVSGGPNLSPCGGGFSNESSDKTNTTKQAVSIATSSTIIEVADESSSVATIPVATESETELILDEKIDIDTEVSSLSATSIDSLNLTDEKAPPANEVLEVSEANILNDSATSISIAKAAEQILGQLVADREEGSPVRFCLSVGAALLPQTLEALTGGEDAYFIAGETWFGVADGVGQWSLEGIDAGSYAHELMENCRRIVSDGGCPPTTDPKEVISCSAAEAVLPGSATILVAYFDGQVLHAANIGDTGFIIVRNGAVVGRSSATVHDFHFPHQIQKGDDPLEFVEWYEIELDEGDVIIAATDGLFDNLYEQEISSIATKSLQANMTPEEVAAILAVKSQEIGRSKSTRSPFADAAQAAGYAGYTGGKLDDVAVIVSVVQKS